MSSQSLEDSSQQSLTNDTLATPVPFISNRVNGEAHASCPPVCIVGLSNNAELGIQHPHQSTKELRRCYRNQEENFGKVFARDDDVGRLEMTTSTGLEFRTSEPDDRPTSLYECRILDSFGDIQKTVWHPATQKFVSDHRTKKRISLLLPDSRLIYESSLERYYRTLHYLKQHRQIHWWADVGGLPESSSSASDVMLLRPVEAALGVRGYQHVLGILSNSKSHEALPSPELPRSESLWTIQDTRQSLTLDTNECDFNGQIFLDTNVVLVSGQLNRDGIFQAVRMAHPLNEPEEAETTKPHTSKTSSESCSAQAESREYLTNAGLTSRPARTEGYSYRWAVLGHCTFRRTSVFSVLHRVLHCEPYLQGIILTGPFSLARGGSTLKQHDDLFHGINELMRTIIDALHASQASNPNRLVSQFQVILVPAPDDVGPRFLPKLPIPDYFLRDARKKFSEEAWSFPFPFSVKLSSASNPTRLCFGGGHQPQHRTRVTEILICRSNLLEHISILSQSISAPFKQPSLPTTEELVRAIPSLVTGQGHIYPVPFTTEHSVSISAGWDFTLRIRAAKMIVVSDNCSAYSTKCSQGRLFGCPGTVDANEYLILDIANHTMSVQRIDDGNENLDPTS